MKFYDTYGYGHYFHILDGMEIREKDQARLRSLFHRMNEDFNDMSYSKLNRRQHGIILNSLREIYKTSASRFNEKIQGVIMAHFKFKAQFQLYRILSKPDRRDISKPWRVKK